jgi:HEAT repeat protein
MQSNTSSLQTSLTAVPPTSITAEELSDKWCELSRQAAEYPDLVADLVAPLLKHGNAPDSPREPFGSPRQTTRFSAAKLMAKCGQSAAARHLPTLLAMIPQDYEEDSGILCYVLKSLNVRESEHVDQIVALLQHERSQLRRLGAYLLLTPPGFSDEEASRVPLCSTPAQALQWKIHVAAVAALLDDKDRMVRQLAPRLLAGAGPAAGPHIGRLIDGFHDSNPSVRRSSATAVGRLRDVVSAEHVAAVVAKLADPDNAIVGGGAISVRRAALLAFSWLCEDQSFPRSAAAAGASSLVPNVAAAAPWLTALLAHEDADAREMSVRAMGGMRELADVPALIGRLTEDEEPDVRGAAVDTLVVLRAYMTTAHLAHVVRLTGCCVATEDDDNADDEPGEEQRCAAVRVLGGIGRAAAPHCARALLRLASEDECSAVRAAAAVAIGLVCSTGDHHAGGAPTAPARDATLVDAIAALGELLGDSDSACRAAAVTALVQLDAVADFEDDVAALLGDRAPAVRHATTAALRSAEERAKRPEANAAGR